MREAVERMETRGFLIVERPPGWQINTESRLGVVELVRAVEGLGSFNANRRAGEGGWSLSVRSLSNEVDDLAR
jgi:hypothetical protein